MTLPTPKSLVLLAALLAAAGCGGKPLSTLSVVGPGTAPTDIGRIVPWSGTDGLSSAGGAGAAMNSYRGMCTPCICCPASLPILDNYNIPGTLIPIGVNNMKFSSQFVPLQTAAQRHADYQGAEGGYPSHIETNTANAFYTSQFYPDRIRAANTPVGTDLYGTTTFVYYENVADAW